MCDNSKREDNKGEDQPEDERLQPDRRHVPSKQTRPISFLAVNQQMMREKEESRKMEEWRQGDKNFPMRLETPNENNNEREE